MEGEFQKMIKIYDREKERALSLVTNDSFEFSKVRKYF